MTDNASRWQADFLADYVGKTIKEIRPFTAGDIRAFGWEHVDAGQPVIIVFTDGSEWVPLSDPEGNGPGFIEHEG